MIGKENVTSWLYTLASTPYVHGVSVLIIKEDVV